MNPLRLYGQEINPSTFAISRMNAFLHDMEAEIALGEVGRGVFGMNELGVDVPARRSISALRDARGFGIATLRHTKR